MSTSRGAVFLLVGTTLLLAGCSGAQPSGMDDMPGMAGMTTVAAPAEAAPAGDALADAVGGYRLVLGTVPAAPVTTFTFHITGPDGHPVTRYQPDESALVQFEVIRSDLSNDQHLDPAMRQDGTWVAPLPALAPGSYRAYVSFAAPNAGAGTPKLYHLSQPFTVPGPAADTAPSAPAATAEVGYAVTLSGQPVAGRSTTLHVAISSAGRPVTYLQRYLDGYAHLTAFHSGDLATARLSPAERPTAQAELTSRASFPEPGTWRVFVRFRTSGPILTAAFTITVN